jgi:hypothetical protein
MLMLQQSPDPNLVILKMETAYSLDLSEQTYTTWFKNSGAHRLNSSIQFPCDFKAIAPVMAQLLEVDAEVLYNASKQSVVVPEF